jgi:hypothetical protein
MIGVVVDGRVRSSCLHCLAEKLIVRSCIASHIFGWRCSADATGKLRGGPGKKDE